MTTNPYNIDLDRNPANHIPLTPLTFLDRAASVFPNHIAIVHGALRRNYAEFYMRSRQLASALAQNGIGRGDTVSAMLANTPAMLECHYGVPMSGGVLHSVNTRLDASVIAFQLDHAMSKVVNEVTARSFQRRSGIDIYGLRINNVIEPHEYAQNFPAYLADPALRRRNIFAYIDARDLGHMVDCCLRSDGLGYQIFNVTNDDHSVNLTTRELIARYYDGVEIRQEMGEHETFYSSEKAKRMLGYAPKHHWRMYLDDPSMA